MKVVLAVCVAAAALVLAACGGDDETETEPGPDTLVPASSLIYAEAVLRPEGEQHTALETSLAALLDVEDPGALIIDELDRQIAESGDDLTYTTDIEPWLGERGSLFFTELYGEGSSFAGEGIEGAFVIQATDTEAAQAFADKLAEDSDEGEDVAVVGDALVAGSEAGVQAVIDTEDGGESLADDPTYDSLLGEQDAAASLFVNIPDVVAAAEEAGELEGEELETIQSAFAGVADQPLTATVDVQPDGFAFDVSYGAGDFPFLAAAEESALLRELPIDTWFAFGLAGAGDAIGSFVESAEDLGVTEDELESAREQFRDEFDLEFEDFYEPLGDGAFFANGEGIFGTGGGLVFETDDPESATKLIVGLQRAAERGGEQVRRLSGDGASGFSVQLAEIPGTVNFVAGGDRIVIAYGEAAASAALEPDASAGTLAEAEGFTTAETALGEGYDVTTYVDFAPLAELLNLAAATDPGLQQALPYLESLDFLITGSSGDGERVHQRAFLGIADVIVDPSA